MPAVQTIHPKGSELFEILSTELKTHYVKVSETENSDRLLNLCASEIVTLFSKNSLSEDLLLIEEDMLYVFKKQCYIVYSSSNLRENISSYVLDNYKYDSSNLSCRIADLHLLNGIIINGSPDFSRSPEKWVRGNPFFDRLKPRPFYDRLLAFNLDKRGMFLKVWTLRAQRNYFHPAVNSGLPLIKKDDAIHEGTFMMHDMFHHIFLDPIITGHETEEEKIVYIASRMLSEACTLVLADMVAVAHADIESIGYDTTQRKIYPLFKSLKLNPYDIETIRKILYANCVYVIFGDTSVYKSLGAPKDVIDLYTSKYENFFSGDFSWNETNIKRVLFEMKGNSGLKKYFKSLDKRYKKFNTRSLTNNIKTKNEKLSFNKLFEVFWEQLVELIMYEANSNELVYAQTAYLKYISGQMYIVFKYDNSPQSKKLIDEYTKVMSELRNARSLKKACLIGSRFVSKINKFIDKLAEKNVITRVEAEICKLHVPHFPAEYVNYDVDNFEPLKKVSKRIIGDYFVKEDFKYKKMDKALRDYYFKIVGGEYAKN